MQFSNEQKIRSNVKGISFDKSSKKHWKVRYYGKDKTHYVGRFESEEKAIEALKKFEIKIKDEKISLE